MTKQNNENLDNVLKEVKDVDNGINGILIPILKDTITDCNDHNTRLFILNMIELIIIVAITISSGILFYKQNLRYNEFLSQFDFETEYIQDVNATNNHNTSINPNLCVDK